MTDWQNQVTESLRRFEVESQNFILSVRESNTYWNLMSRRLGEVFTGRRQETSAENHATGSYNILLQLVGGLGQKGVGVSKGMTRSLLAFMRELNNIEAKSIESGLGKAEAARRATLAAPFVPLTMYFAPFLAYLCGKPGRNSDHSSGICIGRARASDVYQAPYMAMSFGSFRITRSSVRAALPRGMYKGKRADEAPG